MPRGLRIGFVVWSGLVGGAEVFTVDLAAAMCKQGTSSGVVVVARGDGPLIHRLEEAGIPRRSLGLSRGSHVLVHARRLADAAASFAADGVILQSDGYLAAALRAGGYGGKIVAVQHGPVMQRQWLPRSHRLLRQFDQLSGVWAIDALVAVSDVALSVAREHHHPRRTLRVYNGVDLGRFRPSPPRKRGADSPMTVGIAGRLVKGKGADVLLESIRRMSDGSVTALLAGDGPQRRSLEMLAKRLGIASRVAFVGIQSDMASFWRRCDLAVAPSHAPLAESFGLAAVEAMASGLPIVASRNGALPEIIADARTGTIVPEADPVALAAALDAYAMNPQLRAEQGLNGRADCEHRFDINRCARAYLELFHSLGCPKGRGV